MPPREPHISDPLVSVQLWTGPASALAARLGMSRIELARALKTVGRSRKGRLTPEQYCAYSERCLILI